MEKFIDIIKIDDTKYDKLAKILKDIIDECEINQNKYFILGSYAIREHRDINDLDINMDVNEFLKLSKVKYGSLQFYNGQIRWFFDLTQEYRKYADENANDFSIEIFQKDPNDGFPNSNFSLKYLSENDGLTKDEYGHQYFNFKTLLKWKQTMNREKDQNDIKLLEKILGKQDGGYKIKYMKYKNKYLSLKDKF